MGKNNIKRIILTREQLNEVLKETTTTVQINTTGNTIPAITNAVTQNQPEINSASKYGDVDLHISNQNANGSNDSAPTQHVNVGRGENIQQAIQQQVNPDVPGDIDVSGDGISEHKCFSKRQIEEARLKKIHESHKMTKKELQENFNEEENKIEIDPKNKGKFNATKKRTGKSTEELTHSKNPLTRKRANFAKMAKRNWKPLEK